MAEKKPAVKKKKSRLMHTYYDIQGDSAGRKNSFCVKCGPGFFLAKHSDRVVCGKCGYVEIGKKV